MQRFGQQTTLYSVILRNNTAYSPKSDPALDVKLDAWVRDFFTSVHSYLNEDPVLKVATLPVPDMGSFVPTVEVPKPPSSDTVTLRAQNGMALWMHEEFVALPKNNRILLATKDRGWERWMTGGWLAGLLLSGGTVFGYPREGLYEYVIINDDVYENFPTQMAD